MKKSFFLLYHQPYFASKATCSTESWPILKKKLSPPPAYQVQQRRGVAIAIVLILARFVKRVPAKTAVSFEPSTSVFSVAQYKLHHSSDAKKIFGQPIPIEPINLNFSFNIEKVTIFTIF